MLPERLAVIGDPIDHSLSPAMHSAALRATGLRHVYERRLVRPEELRSSVEDLRHAYRGFSVTIPHKVAITPLLDALDGTAEETGAANTVCNDAGWLTGYNTDVAGFIALLAVNRVEARGCQVVLFGAGGAARSVTVALGRLEAAEIVVVSRDLRRARSLPVPGRTALTVNQRDDPGLPASVLEADVIVNATSLGLGGLADLSPLPAGARLRPDTAIIDLVYGRRTPFLRQADEQGCKAVDGLEMLVQQGAAAFRLWTGVEPAIDAMRAACREAVPC